MNKKIFKQDAKTLVDTMFDIGMFKEGITRDYMKEFEDLINHILFSRFESHLKAQKLFESIEKIDKK